MDENWKITHHWFYIIFPCGMNKMQVQYVDIDLCRKSISTQLRIYLTSAPQAGCDTWTIFKWSKAGFHSKFSFSKTGCLTKTKEPSRPYNLPITGGFMPFPRALMQSETQTASSRFELGSLIAFPIPTWVWGSRVYLV